ncbi:MAG: hypothetical protein FWE32_01390 [Oscillospiraceae bacterium]|nr:hypothetical protein [Oscillospiraceae bacterium]
MSSEKSSGFKEKFLGELKDILASITGGGGRRLSRLIVFAGLAAILLLFIAQLGSVEEPAAAPPPLELEPLTVHIATDVAVGPRTPVTLVFSQPVDIESLEQALTIRPSVDYTLNQPGEYTIIVRPVSRWQDIGGSARIEIGADYISQLGGSFDSRQTLRFLLSPPPTPAPTPTPRPTPQPREEDLPAIRYWGSGQSFILNDCLNFSLYFEAQNLEERVPVAVETYRMPSIGRLSEQGHIFLEYEAPLTLLERIDANVFLIETGENDFSIPHFGNGAYILAVTFTDPHTGEESHHRASYLVTPLSVYMQTTVRDTLVWVNSSQTGGPIPGLRIHFGEDEESAGITDANGMAFFSRDIEDDESAFRIYNQSGEMVYFDNGVAQFNHGIRERYYSYLFLDRTIYRPQDTISFWGIVEPFRTNELPMPETVRVTFDAGGLNIEQDLPIGPGGVFSGEFEIDQIRSAQYSLQASLHFPASPSDGDEDEEETEDRQVVFEVRYFSVRDFHKPAYTISSEVRDAFHAPTDTVQVTAHIAFFDGTPLPNSPVEVAYFNPSTREWAELGEVLTDAEGNATFSFPAWVGGGTTVHGTLTTNSYRIRVAGDGEDITHMGSYFVFPSDILINAFTQRNEEGDNISLTIETFMIDFASEALLEEATDNEFSLWRLGNDRMLEIARGRPVDIQDIRIDLSWDFLGLDGERVRHNPAHWRQWLFDPDYSYQHIVAANPDIDIRLTSTRGIQQLLVNTQDGVVTINDIIYTGRVGIDFSHSAFAHAVITANDTQGNSRIGWGYYPNSSLFREDWGIDEDDPVIYGYSLAARNITQGADIPAHFGHLNFIQMNVGEVIRFNVLHDSQPAASGGRILYSIVQDGVFEHRLVHGSTFDFRYDMAHGPNIFLVAVYFDGREVHPLGRIFVNATHQSMTLNVEVTPDREMYSPGDTVHLTVRTTDPNGNGRPASIAVAVVDEAVFAVSEQHISLLSDLYHDIRGTNNQVRQYFTTHRRETRGRYQDANKTGNRDLSFTDDSLRSNFRDTAAFLPATTNASGYAHLSFELPDNNTSWRITSVAVGNNRMGGQSRDNIISTLPFFVRPVVNTKYIEGDDIALLVQGQGIVLSPESEVDFSVTITGDEFSESYIFTGSAYTSHQLNFGQLPSGMYTAVFRARYGDYTDAVELPISVIHSNLELVVSRPLDLSQPIEVDASRFPVTITFYDQSAQPFITSINSLMGHYCMITKQRMSRVVAKHALRDSLPGLVVPSYIARTDENIADMQNANGGIGASLGGNSDVRITTFVLLAAQDDQFDRRAMAAYFDGMLASGLDPMATAAARLGLAYLGDESMTGEFLLREAEHARDPEVRAYYIAALAVIGETEAALELYNRHFSRLIIEDNALTAAVWVAATLLGHEDADEIALFFGNRPWRFHTLYEAMIYVRNFDRAVETSTLLYSINGTQHSIEFGVPDLGRYWSDRPSRFMSTIVLSRSELESFEIDYLPEGIRASIYYIGSPAELGLEQSENMRIEQSISPLDDQTFEVTLTISLSEDAPLGQYDISAWIPSNTRLYGHDTRYEIARDQNIRFNTRQEMQNLYISFENRRQAQQMIVYTFRVRQTFESNAVLDTVYMIHGDTGENANSGRGMFSTAYPGS